MRTSSTMRSKFYHVKRFLLGEGSSLLRSSLRKKSSFYENEVILLGKESSIMRGKCFWEKKFCQEKEVLLLQRIFYHEEGVLVWKNMLCLIRKF